MIKIKLPKVIKLGFRRYKLQLVPHLVIDDDHWGFCIHNKQLIQIDADARDFQKTATLIHEVLHAISLQYHLDLKEEDVDRIASGFTDFMVNSIGIDFDWSKK